MILTAGTPRFAINSFWMDLLIGKDTFLSAALSLDRALIFSEKSGFVKHSFSGK
jgi:hypothetical protein